MESLIEKLLNTSFFYWAKNTVTIVRSGLNLTKIKQFIQSRQRLLKLEQIQVSHYHVLPNTYEQKKNTHCWWWVKY
jgi:hypothetical protein